MMYVGGKMKSGKHPPARDASTTTSSASGFPKAGTGCFSATETVLLSGRSLLFLYPEPVLLFLIKLIRVPGLMMELSAQLLSAATVLSGLPDAAEPHVLHLSCVRVTAFGVWWGKLSKAGRRNFLLWMHDEQ